MDIISLIKILYVYLYKIKKINEIKKQNIRYIDKEPIYSISKLLEFKFVFKDVDFKRASSTITRDIILTIIVVK